MTHGEALCIAEEIVALLRPACERIEIAGGVRRGKPNPHDLELVAIPIFDTDLLGEPAASYGALDAVIQGMVTRGVMVLDPVVKRNGLKLKRFLHCQSGAVVELYLADKNNWGCIYTIRTGDRDFTNWLVTGVDARGPMPRGKKQHEGYLRTWPEGVVIPCSDEETYFREIGVRWVHPSARNLAGIARLRRARE